MNDILVDENSTKETKIPKKNLTNAPIDAPIKIRPKIVEADPKDIAITPIFKD